MATASGSPSAVGPVLAPPGQLGPYINDPSEGQEFQTDPRYWRDREDMIRTLYRQELGREAEDVGLQYWMGRDDLQGHDLLLNMREAAGLDNSLYVDPAYAVFMRQKRQREATIEADRAESVRDLDNQRRLSTAMFERQERQGLQRVNDAAEARGMFRSGGRIRDRGQVATDIALNRANTERSITEQQGDVNRAAAAQLAGISRERDEQEVATRNTLTNQSIQEAARG